MTSEDATMNFTEYLRCEILGSLPPDRNEVHKNEIGIDVNNVLQIPWELEKFLGIGVFICFDTFLYFFTYFPLRVAISLYQFLLYLQSLILETFTSNHLKQSTDTWTTGQIFDLLRASLILSSFYVLNRINLSNIYHLIRSQNTIKLYVLSSMIDVIDKLLASFGQDLFDSIQFELQKNRRLPITATLTTFLYVMIHSLLYLLQVATLTVVINSADDALLTVLILNNFAELKSYVFKKYDVNNLFQLSCSDVMERFQLIVFTTLVFFASVVQGGFSWWDYGSPFFWTAFKFLLAEALADSFKHCFICKFNTFPSTLYRTYRYIVVTDLLSCGKETIVVDHTYSISRRLGLSQVRILFLII